MSDEAAKEKNEEKDDRLPGESNVQYIIRKKKEELEQKPKQE